MDTNKQRNLLSWGIILGAAAGAVSAYFLAPQSGEKTKATVARNLNNFTQHSILKTQNVLLQFEDLLEEKRVKE